MKAIGKWTTTLLVILNLWVMTYLEGKQTFDMGCLKL